MGGGCGLRGCESGPVGRRGRTWRSRPLRQAVRYVTMAELPDPVVYAVPAFILLLIGEMLISLRRDRSRYEARDTLTSLMLGTGSQVAGAAVGAVVVALAFWAYQYRLFDIEIGSESCRESVCKYV